MKVIKRSLNSTMVRLKLDTIVSNSLAINSLNSTMVRLKLDSGGLSNRHWQRSLNSTMVRLKLHLRAIIQIKI